MTSGTSAPSKFTINSSVATSPKVQQNPDDALGMVTNDLETEVSAPPEGGKVVVRKGVRRKPRKKITYISRHFDQDVFDGNQKQENTTGDEDEKKLPTKKSIPTPRIYHGINVDEYSSDSSLTDVPEDIGPDPFEISTQPSKVRAVKVRSKNPIKSPYFQHVHNHRHRSHFLSTLPFPPLSAPIFGLMQERLAHDPFRLLIATIFLNKTPGERAMPVFYQLMDRYPTPKALSEAKVEDVTAIIHKLGFQNQRARKCVAMAKVWIDSPPVKGKRYRKLHYPAKGDGKDIKDDLSPVEDDDPRVAWEISRLPGVGAYSHDSWRIFCRDRLRGLATSWLGENAEPGFEPEWKRVVPLDKELRAYLTWMWLKEGWIWNKETGERTKAPEELLDMARGGGILQEEREKEVLVIRKVDEKYDELDSKIEKVDRPAGDFMPTVW